MGGWIREPPSTKYENTRLSDDIPVILKAKVRAEAKEARCRQKNMVI